jgi:hypothetical protein
MADRKLNNLKRRVNRARNNGVTTPASRHLHLMADCLASGKRYAMFEEEPEFCAETMYLVLETYWKLRKRKKPSPETRTEE